jgi:ATP-dependent helicase/nuclease subunit A
MTKDGSARKFSDKLSGIEQVRQAQSQLARIMAAQQQHEAWIYQQRMTRLTRVLIAEFAALKRAFGWIDMNDLERAGLYLLADPMLGAWVQERLDARVRHLLIDEFQDTNPLQWQALSAWLGSYAGAGGGAQAPRVFIVGDPKQSIYRFRRAEPQVFVAAQKFVVEQLAGDRLSCDHTRRNAPAVLALVNQVMSHAQEDDNFQGFRVHTTQSDEAGAVLKLPRIERPAKLIQETMEPEWRDSLTTPRELPEETLLSLECRQAAAWIATQLQEGVKPDDIMVLARKRDRLTAMQEALQALHIPSLQPEKSDLGDMPEVQDIVALLDVLVSPLHDLSLAQALKSPLFGVSDEALIQLAVLASSQTSRRSWLELLQSDSQALPAWPGIGEKLRFWQGWLGTLPPHDALDAIYQDGDVLARFAAATPATLRASVLANLRALLSAALQIDGARYATPYAFVRSLKAGGVKAPARAASNAVRLLTVHGAKGLEASLVLLLDTDAQEKKAQTMSVLVDWPGESPSPQSFVFLASESHLPASVEDAMARERLARSREEINALYVAMTRAQHQLVLSSVEPHLADASSWWQRMQAACQPLTLPEQSPKVIRAELEPIRLHILPACEAVDMPVADSTSNSSMSSLSSRIGQAMHRLLEWAPLGAQNCPASQVQQVAQEFGLDAEQGKQAAAMAQRILSGEGRWAWDDTQIDWYANELTVVVQGQARRIDRLLRLKSGQWWVLDYKSAGQALEVAELKTQLRSYLSAVQAAYPGEPVKAGFLSAQGSLEILEDTP